MYMHPSWRFCYSMGLLQFIPNTLRLISRMKKSTVTKVIGQSSMFPFGDNIILETSPTSIANVRLGVYITQKVKDI